MAPQHSSGLPRHRTCTRRPGNSEGTRDTRAVLQRLGPVALGLAALLATAPRAGAAVPGGFEDTVFVSGIAAPSVLAFAPDGRLFVGEKASGRIRIVKNGTLLATPFLDLHDFVSSPAYFDSYWERGLLGIAFHPSFATNQLLYVYFTVCLTPGSSSCQTAKNRIVRFKANGDVVDPASYTIILNNIDSDAGNHNAGWIACGPTDGKLYASTGDGGSTHTKSQDLSSLSGKVLRLNLDGTIPSDNPFFGQSGRRGEIWASGLRNPWRCRFAPDGRLFCADVGQDTWEEIDLVTRGANFGWPTTEGSFTASSYPQFTNPIHTYNHTSSSVAIVGGDFGSRTTFPDDYRQSYFFADYGQGWIKRALLDASGVTVQSVQSFATGLGAVTDLVAGPDGALYYAGYSGAVHRIAALGDNQRPVARASANPTHGGAPLTVQFSSAGSSDPDGDALTYAWNFGDGTAASTAANPSHVYQRPGAYTATVTVSDGSATPGPGTAAVAIQVGGPPVATIHEPTDGTPFSGGEAFDLVGSAADPEDGNLPSSSLHWRVVFHHDTHIHPYIDDLPGSPQRFATATSGETSANVWYEIILTATDRDGISASTSVRVLPRTANLSLMTDPTGLSVTLDGQPVTTPFSTTGIVGVERTLGASSPQTASGGSYTFSSWSDGGSQSHIIVTPDVDTAYVARFTRSTTTTTLPGGGSCSRPIDVASGGGTYTGTTTGSSGLSASCGSAQTSPEQVYRWTPTTSGTATIHTCGPGTNYDTVIYVRSGNCGSGTQLACNDDTTGCAVADGSDHHGSRVNLTVTAGQIYFIVVDGYGGKAGSYTLTVTPPAGTCAAPSVIPAAGGTFTGTNSGNSSVGGSCGSSGSSPEQVFQWTPAKTGTARIETCGGSTAYDTVVYVRQGTCSGGTELACNDDTQGCATASASYHGSRVTPSVQAGTTYFIVVDGYGGRSGAFTLSVTPP